MLHTHVKILPKTATEPAFPELASRPIRQCELDRVVVHEGGMDSGRSSVSLLVDLPDGSVCHIQTSARNFEMIAAAVRGACQSWGEDNR